MVKKFIYSKMLDGIEKTNSGVPLLDISRWTVSPYICVFFLIKKIIKQFFQSLDDSQFLHFFIFVSNKMTSMQFYPHHYIEQINFQEMK